ncbi:MAG: hypothetical protein KKG33_04685 [candidate division Zixibacteria bacterium]|nr:hypothetical protein [candidate division Zixibacteria bacterium]MBU1471824.1 hypothetical protein [candidate division Zixibacteria bacterium]MBU2624838.1 hypothetical protein [candidate division Zixibacteria bacterium]
MIEKISNETVHVRPRLSLSKNVSQSAVTVGNNVEKTADYLYDPLFSEKVNASRHSINEELVLLSEMNRNPENAGHSDEQQGPAAVATSLDILERSLLRMKSLLYQVASVTAADPDTLDMLQRKLADELRGYKKAIADVDLPEFSGVDLTLNGITIANHADSGETEQVRLSDTLKTVESAVSTADSILLQIKRTGSRNESKTEAALSTAGQNMAAAESTIYPEEILARAKEVARSLREEFMDAPELRRSLKPEEVLGLIDTGQ